MYNTAKFLKSVASMKQLPENENNEVAFVGRSNSGKSSSINAITNIKKLAKTSKTPGRTQLINFFELKNATKLVDLPGYGYAKVNDSMKKSWEKLIDSYLMKRQCLAGIVITMDIRHPLKDFDQQMIEWCYEYELPVHILLTKSDKLTNNQAKQTVFAVEKALKEFDNVTVQLFSSLKNVGIDLARKKLDEWLLGTTS